MSLKEYKQISNKQKKRIQVFLLSWGSEHKRVFPWREDDCSAYEMLLAEILLRKTRAETVIPVFNKLISKFPSFGDLLNSDIDELETMLQPLGLHKIRASAMIRIAEIITDKYKGIIPQSEKALIDLPHIGRYSANAVLCFHFEQDRAIVDANIHRLLCRHFGFAPVVEIHKADSMWNFMQNLIPKSKAKNFNYALLDYCALVCTSNKCNCSFVFLPNQ